MRSISLGLSVLFLALAVSACSESSRSGQDALGGETPASKAAPDVPRATRGYLLISLDTLRADHLGLYGYSRPTSPFLDRWASNATVFENAWVQYPSTLTSHMSIFTGLYPPQHGVYPPNSVLSAEITTLPELFQAAGYRTGGFTEGGFMQGRFGFRRGFDVFDARDRKDADAVRATFRRGLQFLENLEEDEPFFLFLHTYSVHAPYEPPERFRKLFASDSPPPGAFEPTGAELRRHNILDETLDPAVRDYFIALYDAEIRRLDEEMERLFERLDELGLSDDLTVIVTSDHGEEFEDHGRVNHTQLYRETLRVPLLIAHPDLDGRRDADLAESVDLAPTLIELARLDERTMSGVSLAARLIDAAESPKPVAFGEVGGGVFSAVGASPDGPKHLLIHEPDNRWAARNLFLETREGALEVELLSYQTPRSIEIRIDEELLHQTQILPDTWTPVDLRLGPPGTKRRLTLTSDGCEPVKNESGELRCLGFRLRGASLRRVELFDVDADPDETIDLSEEFPADVRLLIRSLESYRSMQGAAGAVEELDPELRKRLEELGYLD